MTSEWRGAWGPPRVRMTSEWRGASPPLDKDSGRPEQSRGTQTSESERGEDPRE